MKNAKARFQSLAEIQAQNIPDPEFILHNLLLEGGITLLCGDPKCGKSTFSRQLMAAVSNGDDFLGFKTKKAKVYYHSLEDRIKFSANSLQALSADMKDTHILTEPIDDWAEYFKDLDDGETKLIVLDTLCLNLNISDLNDYAKVTKAIKPFKVFAGKSKSHIMMLHHLGKNKEQGAQSQILGSTALAGIVESSIILRRDDNNSIYLTNICRYGEAFKDLKLDYDKETEIFSVAADQTASVEVDEVGSETLDQRILTYIKDKHSQASNSEIKSGVKGKASRIVSALNKLVADHKLIKSGEGTKSSPYFYRIYEKDYTVEQEREQLVSSEAQQKEPACS